MGTRFMPVSDLRRKMSEAKVIKEQRYPRPRAQYPTVANSPASLKEWLDLIPAGCGGDALTDTEALYDEV